MLNSGKKIPALHDKKNKYSNSHVVGIFFPEFNIRLYDKNSESDYFFSLHQN